MLMCGKFLFFLRSVEYIPETKLHFLLNGTYVWPPDKRFIDLGFKVCPSTADEVDENVTQKNAFIIILSVIY
jgi:hypothetical protein